MSRKRAAWQWSGFRRVGDEERQQRHGTRGTYEVYRRLGCKMWHLRQYDKDNIPGTIETCLPSADCARAVAERCEEIALREPDALGHVSGT